MLNIKRTVRVVDGCEPDDIPQFILNSDEPLILKGLVEKWPLVEAARTSTEAASAYLKTFYRGSTVNAAYGPSENNGRIFYSEDMSGFNYERRKTSLDKFL
ncbi:MAG: cupin-like domain-containing protein, partial [Sphingobacteriales bacterium]